MKKYVHVWFVILATLLSIVLGTTAQAHPHGVNKHHITKHKKKQAQYTAKKERAVLKRGQA